MGHLYLRIEALRRDTVRERESGMDKLSAVLEKLRTDIDNDRQRGAAERATIAGVMVTRGELDKQVDRILQQLERNRTTSSPHV